MSNKKILLALSAVIAVSACQPEEEFGVTSSTPAGETTISAILEQPEDGTKTTMSSAGKVLWSAGDEVSLMTPGTNDKFTLTSGAKSGSAAFTGTITGTAPYYLLYPYSDDCSVADGKMKFKLPQEQTATGAGTFGQGASPAIAFMSDYGVPAQFKNLCGILEVSLCGAGVSVSKITVSDLNGDFLWGDCEVVLDGTQGTNDQTMTISGGSNTITLNLSKAVSLKAASASLFEIVVPAGSFSKGMTVKVYDEDGKALSFLTTQNASVKTSRSMITAMSKTKLTKDIVESKNPTYRGYYKELIVNRGAYLSGQTDPPAADSLGWQHDYVSTNDSIFQASVFVGNADDPNGALLYPDGAPRYCMMFVNGGSSRPHGRMLGATGRASLVAFVDNGGSYVGSCAGCILTAMGFNSYDVSEEYLHIWPGHCQQTGMSDTSSSMIIEPNCPLLKYFDFGGDMRIDSIYHNWGSFMDDRYPEKYPVPEGTEYLMRYDGWPGEKANGKVSCWAYKANENKGRIVVSGSHPESVKTGERLHMMMSMYLYATEGHGKVWEKSPLVNGQTQVMDQFSTANKPENARIGDKQYHHFRIDIPAGGAKNFTLKLTSESSHNLMLSLRKGDLAWMSDADFLLAQGGANKTLSLENLPEGTWYASVYGYDAPETICESNKFQIKGDVTLLNGVPYSITASWE